MLRACPTDRSRVKHNQRRAIRRTNVIASTGSAHQPLTTKPDHNRIRHDPIPADTLMTEVPGERPYPTTWAYFASRGSPGKMLLNYASR